MKRLFLAVQFLFLALTTHSQITLGDILGRNPPVGVDTNYYPFYNGVQMIEIDNVGSWERAVAWHEMSQPRALSWSMLIPWTGPNIYLFRDQSGKIVKAFNTKISTEQLTNNFRRIPIKQKSQNLSHQLMGGFHTGKYHVDLYSYNSRYLEFNGLYKVYDMDSVSMMSEVFGGPHIHGKAGLIDSLGNFFLDWEYDNIIPAGQNIVTCKSDECMMINRNKESMLSGEYTSVNENYLDEFVFYRNEKIAAIYYPKEDKVHYINEYDWIDFENMHYARNNSASWRQPGLFRYSKSGKFGFISAEFEEISPAVYDKIYWFNEGRAMVCKDGKFGYIDSAVAEIIPCRYEYGEMFRSGIAVVIEGGREKCIDKSGSEVTTGCRKKEEWRHKTGTYVTGMTIVGTNTGYGVINSKQEFVVPPVYEQIRPIRMNSRSYKPDSLGYFDVTSNKKHGIVDAKGKLILPLAYDEISEYPNDRGFRAVKKNGKWGAVNSRWQIIVPCVYDEVSVYSGQSRFAIANYIGHGYPQKRVVGLTDTSGKIIVAPYYSSIHSFKNGWAMVMKDSLCGFIDSLGNIVIPLRFERLNSEFHNGLCLAYQNGKAGFIDTTGAIVIPCIYDDARVFTGEATGVKQGEKWALIDGEGKLITDFVYDYISYEWRRDGEVQVRRDGKLGYINARGKVVIPIIYDDEWGYGPDKGHLLEKDGKREWVKAK